MVGVISFLIPLPLTWALGARLGHLGVALLAALLATTLFVHSFRSLRRGVPSLSLLYLGLWPFFGWWSTGLVFAVVHPLVSLSRPLWSGTRDEGLILSLSLAGAGALYGLWQRPRLRHREIFVRDLPEAWDGYRIAHITDLHCGPFASAARVSRWVSAVNALSADLVAVTGDLITQGTAYVVPMAQALGGLRAADGVFACMGNHDYFTAGDEVAVALERAGLSVLRNRGVVLEREETFLYVAGVDDTWTERNDLPLALADRPPQAPVVLLAHDPSLFPSAAAAGVDVMLSGHTHGGQIGVPLLAHRWNLARLITRFTTDLYRRGSCVLYVNRGLGTTGPPLRLFVRSEIALLVLRRDPSLPQGQSVWDDVEVPAQVTVTAEAV
jgi:predicted MPP superfamily phosphohydrolase